MPKFPFWDMDFPSVLQKQSARDSVGQHFGFSETIVESNTGTQKISLADNCRVSNDVVFREVDGAGVILNIGTGIYFGLNETGTRVWNLIDQHSSLLKVFEVMAQEYDVPSETIQKDILQIVEQLCENRLLCKT